MDSEFFPVPDSCVCEGNYKNVCFEQIARGWGVSGALPLDPSCKVLLCEKQTLSHGLIFALYFQNDHQNVENY